MLPPFTNAPIRSPPKYSYIQYALLASPSSFFFLFVTHITNDQSLTSKKPPLSSSS